MLLTASERGHMKVIFRLGGTVATLKRCCVIVCPADVKKFYFYSMKLCHLRPPPVTATMSQEGTNADKDIICTLLEYLHFCSFINSVH